MGESAHEADGTTVAKRLAHAKVLLPQGDIVLPPLCISGQARESKSYLILALIGVVLQNPNVKVALSVAPHKLAALDELLGKLATMNWEGYAKIDSTRHYSKPLDEDVPNEVIKRFCSCRIFLYSHCYLGDVQTFKEVVKQWRKDGHAVLSIHDEADTLVRALCKIKDDDGTNANDDEEKDTILNNLRDSYSPYWARTVLVGATQLATLQEQSMWGSQLLGSVHTDLAKLRPNNDDPRPNCTWLVKPLKPATGGGAHYVGLDNFDDLDYDDADTGPDGPHTMTAQNINRTMLENRKERMVVETAYWETRITRHKNRGVVRGRAVDEFPKATKADPNPTARPPVLDPKTGEHVRNRKQRPLYYTETPEEAKLRYESSLHQFKAELKTAKSRNLNAVPEQFAGGNKPALPLGFCTPWKDELGFAMITQRVITHLTNPHPVKKGKALPGELEDHYYNKMLVLSPTYVANRQDNDPAGGLLGYGRLVVNQAKRLKRPTVVMVYCSTAAGPVAEAMGNDIKVKPKQQGAPKSEGDSVKMVVVLPGEDEAEVSELEVHGSAKEALTAAHRLMVEHDCADKIEHMSVVAIGYGLFSAALTLSVSDLELPAADPTDDDEKVRRLHYIPKGMVFCKAGEGNNQAVQYQTLGRCMNTLIGFLPDEPFGYRIDVLTHAGTLEQAKKYYEVERYMIRLWSGLVMRLGSDPNTGKLVTSGRVPFTSCSARSTRLTRSTWRAENLKVGYRHEELVARPSGADGCAPWAPSTSWPTMTT